VRLSSEDFEANQSALVKPDKLASVAERLKKAK
jgi:hypothetical protein